MGRWPERAVGDDAPSLDGEAGYAGTIVLVLLAPVSVVAVLAGVGNVLAAFVVYHVLVCLLVPLGDSLLLQGRSFSEHLAYIGLRGGREGWLLAGTVAAVLMFASTLGPFLVAREALLGQADLAGTLAAWGLPEGAVLGLVVYMLVFNSVAEELLWRGHLHQRLSRWDRRGAALGLTTLAFASYHTYTLQALVGDLLVTGVLTLGVFLGGLLWAVLREHYGSVVPAAMAHVGATAGYMSVYVLWIA